MAGGIFTQRPFEINVKCIIFSLVCMGLFLARPTLGPHATAAALVAIFVVAYVGMAWYDYYFNCDVVPLRKGYLGGVTGTLKPPPHAPGTINGSPQSRHTRSHRMLVYAFHLGFVVPVMAYVVHAASRGRGVAPGVRWLVGALTVFTAAYHGVYLLGEVQ